MELIKLVASLTLSFLLSASFIACHKDVSNDNSTTASSITEEPVSANDDNPEEIVIYRTTVDELRLRDAAGTTSGILMKLPLRQKLISLKEKSKENFTTTLGGMKVTDAWYKVKAVDANGKTIIGWVFGGGIEREQIKYEQMPAGNYIREIDRLPAKEMEQLIAIDVLPEFDYGGRLSYRKTATDLFLLNGQFEIVSHELPKSDSLSDAISVTYLGRFLDGKLDGEIQRHYYGVERQSVATINFSNGRCSTGLLKEEGKKGVKEFQEPEMGTCTFHYLDDGLSRDY